MCKPLCIMSKKAYRTLAARAWDVTSVTPPHNPSAGDGYRIHLTRRALFRELDAWIAVWPRTLNVSCCDCQYLAEAPYAAMGGLHENGGNIFMSRVLLSDMMTNTLVIEVNCAHPELGRLLRQAARHFGG